VGRWGDGFFDADLPSDVRATWDEVFGALGDPDEALDQVRRHYEPAAEADPADAAEILTAVAILYLASGGTTKRPQRPALRALEAALAGGFLTEEAVETAKEALGAKRRSVPKQDVYEERTTWEKGDVYAYQAASGTWYLLRVVGLYEKFGIKVPVVEALDWTGPEPPDRSVVRSADVKSNPRFETPFNSSVGWWDRHVTFPNQDEDTAFILARKSDKEFPSPERLVSMGKRRVPLGRHDRTNKMVTWRTLDAHLHERFNS